MVQVIIQEENEAAKAAIMEVREADNLVNSSRPIHPMPTLWGSVVRQLMFDWKVADKWQDLCNFEIGVKNISMTNNYNAQESERSK